MTEAEWLTTKLPLYMLGEYPAEWNVRKGRLFWCACLRRTWEQLADERTRLLVEEVELHPEADIDWFVRERRFALEGYINWNNSTHSGLWLDSWALDTFLDAPPGSLMRLAEGLAHQAAEDWSRATGLAHWSRMGAEAEAAEKARQCDIIRDIFGNPFSPVPFAPEWRTDTALSLARQMYDSRDFGAMPILADALQDAGCDNDDILSHCRDTNRVHVRGCWVVDLVLNKE
jgi:hypothetical protein